MKERPILFNSDMVGAIRDGRKTQTRRVMKPQPEEEESLIGRSGTRPCLRTAKTCGYPCAIEDAVENGLCHYGKPGDRLYVRETHYRYGKWVKNGKTKAGRQAWTFKALIDNVLFATKEDGFPNGPIRRNKYRKPGWYKRPSIFMPRWASRITLEVTDVRVERVCEISEEDAEAEGIFVDEHCIIGCSGASGSHQEIMGRRAFATDDDGHEYAVDAFEQLWDSINGKPRKDGVDISWAASPWVWVVTFKRLEER